jgi:hypothetical protein
MRYLPMILLVVLAIYCWVEIVMSDPRQVRQLPRAIWALIVLIPLVGPIGWLVYGRPNGDTPRQTAPKPRPRVVAPDDDPDFLRSLRQQPPDDAL